MKTQARSPREAGRQNSNGGPAMTRPSAPYTRNIVLENENPDLYLRIRDSYLREFAPVGDVETDFVLDIVNARWRLSRILLMETAAIECAMTRQREDVEIEFDRADEGVRTSLAFTGYDGEPAPGLALLGRTEARLQRIIQRSTKEFMLMKRARETDRSPAGPVEKNRRVE